MNDASDFNLDDLFQDWPFDPSMISVRLGTGRDEREVILMRIEMGVLQLETTHRPDGTRPEGADSYFDHLLQLEMVSQGEFKLTEDQCFEVDREFVQFYHRRICWLALQRYREASQDAEHSLKMMDFCRKHSPDEQWTLTHEQYRPFVMYHRIQAAALAVLEDDSAEEAVQTINHGLEQLRTVFVENDVEEHYEEDELVARLIELRETLRSQFEVGQTLQERLSEAVAKEQYELAARLRDELSKRQDKQR